MFTVYHSNKVDTLKILLVHLIKSDPLANPFEKEQILVQSPGMSQWLKMELAKEFGVAANIDFPLPATFIWDMFTQVLPDVPKRSAFNKEAMTWKLMSLLPAKLDHPDFLPLQRYLENDEDYSKLYQLAEKIADIFDGYLVYRPEWMAMWEAGEPVAELVDDEGQQDHPWQPILWQALYDQTLSQGQSKYHRGNLYHDFIEGLANQQGQLQHLPKRLFVFGISSLPPRYMDALKALGEQIDVHLMFTNPCQHYWGDIRDRKYLARVEVQRRKQFALVDGLPQLEGEASPLKDGIEANVEDELHISQAVGNSLLASMGKLGRDNLLLLSQSDSEEHEFFIDVERDNLLHQLQADILQLEEHQDDHILDSSNHKQVVELGDRSLTVHACHSPMREVEVLHDQLLAMFDANPTLKPRDIIVMVSDINAYSPAIQAVFGNAPGERYIPYSISDRTADQESPILTAFMQLVALPNTRCLASELLELLEIPAMMARFGIDEFQFEQAKQWVEEAGIRWGVDSSTATEFDLPATEQNTWLFGIQRMLLGYAMSDSAGLFETEHSPIAAYNEVQGINAELAGKLAHFIDRIAHYRQRLTETQSIDMWRETLLQMIDDFFAVELEGEVVLKSIRDALSQLNEQLDDALYEQELSPSIIYQYLNNKLSGARISQRFLAGQVNFCTLMPMRSIPFKTVCLLGMNDGEQNYCLSEDQALPSDDSGINLTQAISFEHTMTPFSPAAFTQGDASHVLSYAKEWLPAANRSGERSGEFNRALDDYLFGATYPLELDLVELQRFWRLPVQYFFNRRLKVVFEPPLPVMEDDEPFVLNGLESFQLKDALLQVLLDHPEGADEAVRLFVSEQKAQGRLPVGAFGDIEFETNRVQAEDLAKEIRFVSGSPQQDLEVNIEFDVLGEGKPVRLMGWLTQNYQSGLVRFRSGKIRSQDYLAAWIDHLSCAVMG
ncbi:exodeoxyribonuclease V subunit gamma, partial [Vibrio splendidus]|uniref:exodeoxyribonuclease V subunit gamma n=1 Tax=Vibrio splendidus TaxID=29497 RepID=UPI003D105693